MLKLRELERMASSIDHLTACCPLLLVVVLLLLHPEHSKPKSSPAAAVTSDVINDHHIQYIIFITLYLLPLLEIVGTHQNNKQNGSQSPRCPDLSGQDPF
jgi:hypothetical protein